MLDAVLLGEIGKINGLLEDRGSGCLFFFHSFDAQGKRRQRELLIFEFDLRADRLPSENMLGQSETHFDSRETDRRENS